MGQHPVLAGGITGSIEICFTFPLEFVKRQLQLQQQSSTLSRNASVQFTGPFHVVRYTVSTYGLRGLYAGFSPFFLFAPPRSAIRFYTFDLLTSCIGGPDGDAKRNPAVATGCGFVAGLCEAALGQTPCQAIATKMLHDISPAGPKRFRSLPHAVQIIHAEHGFYRGFFCGLEPAVIKGAVTNCIRFGVFGALKDRALRREEQAAGSAATVVGADGVVRPAVRTQLTSLEAVGCGAFAGLISALVSQPIDTVMAQAQGLESHKFKSTWDCARSIVSAGGVRALYNGIGPRSVRVPIEVGLQFSLFEAISPWLDRLLAPPP